MRRLSALSLVLALFAVSVAGAQPAEPRYAAPGPYAVGVSEFVIEDAVRPLEVTVWYPATPPAAPAETARYRVLFTALPGTAFPDAAPDPSGGPYPLVIFSHGLGGFRYQSIYLTEHLASHGFVVMAADHPGSTLRDLMQQGVDPETLTAADRDAAVEPIATSFALRPVEVLRQLAFAETLTAPQGALAGLIDVERTAVVGHSFGGYTTLAAAGARIDFRAFEAACRSQQEVNFDPAADTPLELSAVGGDPEDDLSCGLLDAQAIMAEARGLAEVPDGLWPPTTDPRIRAAVALAPAGASLLGAEGLAALDIPLMIQVGSQDTTTVPERDAYPAYLWAGSADKALVVYEGGGHLLFVGEGLPVSDNAWALSEVHALVNHFSTAFLRSALLGDAAAAAALEADAIDFARVHFLTAP